MRSLVLVTALVMVASPLAAQHDPAHMHTDSAYAAMQSRGEHVMGVDQYTSRHVFEPLLSGGRIELQREVDDSAGTAQIRRHLAEVATAFGRGDFSAPFLVHDQDVPGTHVMAAHKDAISYTVRPLPRGGEIVISSGDPTVVDAVHAFLAFQRQEHRAAAH
ncbi:MAG: hypothetical protein ACHQU1_11625 [Gemmatimonadales bacterium]